MYNDVERCENHMDYFATTGDFDDIFNDVLYGYYYGRDQGGERKHLKFTLFFADPFDPVIRDSDGCGFNKREQDSFKSDLPNQKQSKQKICRLTHCNMTIGMGEMNMDHIQEPFQVLMKLW